MYNFVNGKRLSGKRKWIVWFAKHEEGGKRVKELHEGQNMKEMVKDMQYYLNELVLCQKGLQTASHLSVDIAMIR